MSVKDRKIVEVKIVDTMFSGINRSPISWYRMIFLRFKWKWEALEYWWRKKRQTWQTGFPHEEASEFFAWHAKTVTPRLKHLRDNLTGTPMEMYPEGYDHSAEWEMEDREKELVHERASRKWEKTLDKMIWSFEHIHDTVDPIYPNDYDHRYKMTTYDDGCTGFESMDERQADYSPIDRHKERVQEGLDLFARFYLVMWD